MDNVEPLQGSWRAGLSSQGALRDSFNENAVIHSVKATCLSFCTQASYLSAIRHWLTWLVEQKFMKNNPARDIALPKLPRRLPGSHLTISGVEALLNVVDLSTPSGLRDRAILETFYSTGMRRADRSSHA